MSVCVCMFVCVNLLKHMHLYIERKRNKLRERVRRENKPKEKQIMQTLFCRKKNIKNFFYSLSLFLSYYLIYIYVCICTEIII